MKMKILFGLFAAALLVTGCVSTVSGRKTAAVPFVKDRIEGRYERPVAEVFNAAKDVVRVNGTLLNEVTQHNETNAPVFALEGRVQGRKVFISVTELDPKVTQVITQVRTSAGGTDIDLAAELDKQIALKLVR